jgi:hypothetical protein
MNPISSTGSVVDRDSDKEKKAVGSLVGLATVTVTVRQCGRLQALQNVRNLRLSGGASKYLYSDRNLKNSIYYYVFSHKFLFQIFRKP